MTPDFQFLERIPTNPNADSKMIVMLHGFWSNKEDLFPLVSYFHDDDYIFSLDAPLKLNWSGKAWYELDFSNTEKHIYDFSEVEAWYRYILDFIESMSQKYSISSKNIYLLGFSQGTIMSYYLLSESPDSIAWVIGLSGKLLQEIESTEPQKKSYENKRVFVWHGKQDNVIPMDAAEKVGKWLTGLQIQPTIRLYDMPHTIINEEMNDVIDWLYN